MLTTTSIEANPDIRFGWYLRPSRQMSDAQIKIHRLLEHQYGMIGGGVFMPHATIKGFFRSDAPVSDIVAAFDRAIEGHTTYPVHNAGAKPSGKRGITLDIQHNADGSVNMAQQKLHESGWSQILPLVHPDCNFTPIEGSLKNFHAHLTLSMADMREEFFDEIWDFIHADGPIAPESFIAEYLHLFAFHSEDWHGEWWHTLTWKLLHGWRLPTA